MTAVLAIEYAIGVIGPGALVTIADVFDEDAATPDDDDDPPPDEDPLIGAFLDKAFEVLDDCDAAERPQNEGAAATCVAP